MIFSRGPRFCGVKRRCVVFSSHGRIRHFPTVDRCGCAGEWRLTATPSPLRRGTLAKTEQPTGCSNAPEIATHRRRLFRIGWQRSTKTRTPVSQPDGLSTGSAPYNAMPPTNAVRPRDKNSIVLAIHVRLLDEPCSSKKRIFHASASAPGLGPSVVRGTTIRWT